MPVTVLSGAHQEPERLTEHAAMATRHITVDGSAHWIYLDDPDIVCAAVRQVGQPNARRSPAQMRSDWAETLPH
jgi:pimeloyl-ACP methyl ester carboxylesterase